MDANNESNKADAGAASNASAGLPRVESPNLAPGRSEAEGASPKPSDHRVTTAVALFRGQKADDGSDASAADRSLRARWSRLQIPPLTAAIVLTMSVGALAGALGTVGIARLSGLSDEIQATETGVLKETLAQLSADVAALKAAQESTAKSTGSQLTRVSERLDRAERAQAEPAARIAKLSESLDRLERRVPVAGLPPATVSAAAAPVATSVAPRNQADVTGTIPNTPPAIVTTNKDLSRVPVIQGWVLQKVVDGTAIIHSREGLIEVGVGDRLPGGGRVEAIHRQDGRWIVVTSRGLVVTR